MRKKFAEDDLLGRFRLKNNHALRIELKPTPPEQVEEVKREMEPLIETIEAAEQSKSGLSIDWDTNDIEVPDNMPSDEELKALLFYESKDDQSTEQDDIFKSQRHQKMLELLAKVEALTQTTSLEETQLNATLTQTSIMNTSNVLKSSETEGLFFDGEETGMRPGTEQYQSTQVKETAVEPPRPATQVKETPNFKKPFKLDVDQEDFQERLIRILNENYSDMGEIRPQDLKSKLIEILNEEYSEDYFDEDESDDSYSDEAEDDETENDEAETDETQTDETQTDETQTDEAETDEAETDEAETDETQIDEAETEIDDDYADEVEAEVEVDADEVEEEVEEEVGEAASEEIAEEDAKEEIAEELEENELEEEEFAEEPSVEKETSEVRSEDEIEDEHQPIEAPEGLFPDLKDESGFLSEDYNQNSTESGHGGVFAAYPFETPQAMDSKVSRSRERFSNFQYVTSFQEVTDTETESDEESDLPSDTGLESEFEIESEIDSELDLESVETPSASEPAWAMFEDREEKSGIQAETSSETDLEPDVDSDQTAAEADSVHLNQAPASKQEEHPWLRELRGESELVDSDAKAPFPQSATEQRWASAGASDLSRENELRREGSRDLDHRQIQEEATQEQRRFGAESSVEVKSETAVKNDQPVPEKKVSQAGERYMSVEEWSFVFDTLKEQTDYLKKQLEIKDHQLQNKDELIRNFQILLKNEQDKFLKLENKMEDVVLQVEERAAKKGFFSRFRKR